MKVKIQGHKRKVGVAVGKEADKQPLPWLSRFVSKSLLRRLGIMGKKKCKKGKRK